MTNVKIQAFDNEPFMVKGEIEVIDGQGKVIETKEECYLCRCGLSATMPYCNGAHEGKLNSVVRSK